jgi:dihydropyrimidinase
MADFDLVVRGGTVVTGADVFAANVRMRQGRIAAIGDGPDGSRVLDAGGLLVLPGGVDTHCHIEQLQLDGSTEMEGFATGSNFARAHHARSEP